MRLLRYRRHLERAPRRTFVAAKGGGEEGLDGGGGVRGGGEEEAVGDSEDVGEGGEEARAQGLRSNVRSPNPELREVLDQRGGGVRSV